jgi:hypothetical protein
MVNLIPAAGAINFWLGDAKIARQDVNLLSLKKLLDILPTVPTEECFYTKITIDIGGISKVIYSR